MICCLEFKRISLRVLSFAAVVAVLFAGENCATMAGEPAQFSTHRLGEGVYVHETTLPREGWSPMTVWVYLPRPRSRALPCIVIAAAGSILGMELAAGDRPEHIPYVKHGFATVAYSVDGAIAADAGRAEQKRAMKARVHARGGISNAAQALDYATRALGVCDPARIYAVGHSSAGMVALLFGATDPRIKAVVAYSPVTDPLRRFALADRLRFRMGNKPLYEFLERCAVLPHAKTLRAKPVFLFHALDDSLVLPEQSERLMAAMKPAHPASQRVTVKGGGHYDSMLEKGIPLGIDWLLGVERGRNARQRKGK